MLYYAVNKVYFFSCNMDENHLADFKKLLLQFGLKNLEKIPVTADYPTLTDVRSLAKENVEIEDNTNIENTETSLKANSDIDKLSQAEVMQEDCQDSAPTYNDKKETNNTENKDHYTEMTPCPSTSWGHYGEDSEKLAEMHPRPSTSWGHYGEDSENNTELTPRPSTSMGFR